MSNAITMSTPKSDPAGSGSDPFSSALCSSGLVPPGYVRPGADAARALEAR